MLVPRRVPVVHLQFLITRRSFSLPKLTKGNESIPGKLKVAHQSYLYGPILLIRAIFCHLTLSLPWFICQPCRCSLCISLATLRCLLLPNVHFERVALESRSIEGLHRLLHLFWCLICSSCNATFVDLGKDAFTSLPRDHRKAVISNWNHWNQIIFCRFCSVLRGNNLLYPFTFRAVTISESAHAKVAARLIWLIIIGPLQYLKISLKFKSCSIRPPVSLNGKCLS